MENTITNQAIVYAEVYEILKQMDKETVMKIPVEILNLFKNKRDKNYISRINSNDLFNPNNVEKKTRDIIAWLDLKYWATEEEKEILLKKYKQNEIIAEQKKKEEYEKNRYNDIFYNKTPSNEEQEIKINTNTQLCIQNDNWFKKITHKIKDIINNIKNKI